MLYLHIFPDKDDINGTVFAICMEELPDEKIRWNLYKRPISDRILPWEKSNVVEFVREFFRGKEFTLWELKGGQWISSTYFRTRALDMDELVSKLEFLFKEGS